MPQSASRVSICSSLTWKVFSRGKKKASLYHVHRRLLDLEQTRHGLFSTRELPSLDRGDPGAASKTTVVAHPGQGGQLMNLGFPKTT